MISKSTDTRRRPRLTAIDLFSGCGGLTQGLKEAGFRVLAAVELDPLAVETYHANHSEIPLFSRDIRLVTSTELLHICGMKPGDLDLLAACPPCQGFSRLRNGNRSKNKADPRNRLIDEVLRIIEALRPKVVMLENVPNLARYKRYINFKRRLRQLGYEIADRILDVADFGVPQRRKRLVVLASRVGKMPLLQPNTARETVRNAIGKLPRVEDSKDPLHNIAEVRSERIRRLIASVPKNGGSRCDLPTDLTLRCHTDIDGFYDVYGRMTWDEVAPTITGGCINPSKGRFLHPEENRAITLREAALLQSFPIEYEFSLKRGKYATAELIGNALPPAFSRIQAEAIRSHLARLKHC